MICYPISGNKNGSGCDFQEKPAPTQRKNKKNSEIQFSEWIWIRPKNPNLDLQAWLSGDVNVSVKVRAGISSWNSYQLSNRIKACLTISKVYCVTHSE